MPCIKLYSNNVLASNFDWCCRLDLLKPPLTDQEIVQHYIIATQKGISKVMAKMGISTLHSYKVQFPWLPPSSITTVIITLDTIINITIASIIIAMATSTILP